MAALFPVSSAFGKNKQGKALESAASKKNTWTHTGGDGEAPLKEKMAFPNKGCIVGVCLRSEPARLCGLASRALHSPGVYRV